MGNANVGRGARTICQECLQRKLFMGIDTITLTVFVVYEKLEHINMRTFYNAYIV